MEVSDDFFEWLQSYDAEVAAEPSSAGRLCLSAETIGKLQSGQIFSRILMRLLKLEGSAFTQGNLEFISSETLKIDNWNAVLYAAESIGMRLETEVKELILAGQSDVLLELLEALYSKELEWRTSSPTTKKGRRPKQAPDGALFIESIDVTRPMSEAESCLEFLLIAFCTHFNLKQKQAAGLLTEGNRYLSVLLNKGLKGDFQPLLRMYESIRDSMQQLAECILRESKNGSLTLVASALRPGLQSRSDEVVQEAALFFRDLSKCLNEQNSSLWQWFTGPLGAMDASVSALKRGPARTVQTITEMLFEVSRGRLEEMLTRLKDHLADLQDFLGVVAEMIRYIAEIEEGTDTLVSTGILSSLLETCLREGDVDSRRASGQRLAALNLLAFIWRYLTKEIDQNEEMKGSMLAILKKGCREKSRALSYSCISQMFHLLDLFSAERNAAAGVLFKTLMLMLIESFHRPSAREFLLGNFVQTAENAPSLPVGQLADAVVRQIHLNEGLEFNTFDFDFFIAIARHPRLEEESAVQLIDLLGKVYLSQVHFAKAASIPFLLIASRFLDSDPLQEFVYRFAKLSVQLITQNERTKRGMLKQLPRYLNQPVVLGQPLSLEDLAEETNLLQVRDLVLDLLSKIIKLDSHPLNERLKEILATSAVGLKGPRGDYPRGLLVVLSLIGNPDEILPGYEANSLQLVCKSPGRTPPRHMLALENAAKPTNRHRVDLQKLSALPKVEANQASEKSVTMKPKPLDRMKVMWEKKAEASKTGQAVILDSIATISVETTNVEIGEEDWDLVLILLDKYSRLLKHLFRTNAGSGYHRDMTSNPTFSHIAERNEAMTEGEMLAMLRTLGLSKQFLSKEEFSSMLKSYLKKNGTKDIGYLDFEGFKDMLVKVAVICYSRHDLGHLPPVISVQTLIDEFRDTAAKAGGDTTLYDEPFLSNGDRDILRKLNKDLESDPDIEVPPGYRSKIENDIFYEYLIPEELHLRNSVKTSLELLDEIIFEAFELHIIEPMVVVQEICVAVEDPKPESFTMMSAANPRLARFTPGLKYETIQLLATHEPPLVLECALAIDDLLYAVENQMTAVYPRRREYRMPTKIAAMQEVQQHLEHLERDKSEQRRRARRIQLAQMIEGLSTKKHEEKEKAMRVKAKLDELKRKQEEEKAERNRKEREERMKVLLEWRQKKEEEEARELELEAQRAGFLEQSKRERLAFLRQQRDKITTFAEQKRLEKELRIHEEAEAEQNSHAQKEHAQKKVTSMLDHERVKREQEAKLKADFVQLFARQDIVDVFTEFTPTLDVLFSYYAKVSARDPLQAFVMLLPGLNKLAQDFKIVPSVLSTQEVIQLFRMFTKDKKVETGNPIGLDPREFKESFVRIAAVGQKEIAKLCGLEASTQITVQSCSAEVLRGLFRFMSLPTDPKRAIDLLKKMNLEPPLHPREKKKLFGKTPT